MAPHLSTLAWKIPWTEEPGRLQSMGLLRAGHNWATSLSLFTFMHWRRKWQPTPVFLPGESQGQRSLVGCRLCGRTESDTTKATWQQQQQHTMTLVLSAGFPPFLILIHSFPSKLHIYTHLCTSAPYICPSQLLSQLCLFSPTYHSSIQTQLCVLIWKSFIPINYLVNSDSSLKTEVFLGSKGSSWYFFFCSQISNLYIFLLKYLPCDIEIISFFLTNPQFLNQPEITRLSIHST